MNKGTFASALTEINDDLIIDCLPSNDDIFLLSDKERQIKRALKYVCPIAACLVIAVLASSIIISGINPLSGAGIVVPSMRRETSADQKSSDDNSGPNREYPYTYLNHSENTSLLRVESVSFYDNCYALISREETVKSQKIAVFQATVAEDYYNHLTQGEKIFVAFPLEMFWGRQYTIRSEQLVEAILKCDSFVFYSDSVGARHFIYPDELCSPGEEIDIGKMCFCRYYSDGIIPIVNSCVDFSIIDNMLGSNGLSCDLQTEFYKNIKQSEFSIEQGDSMDKLSDTIQKLIKMKIYGGNFQ